MKVLRSVFNHIHDGFRRERRLNLPGVSVCD